MIRQAPRRLLRFPPPSFRSDPTRRFLSTAPPAQKSRSWRNYATRLALAVGVVYYYNTSTLFAEEPPFAVPPPNSPSHETSLAALESVTVNRRVEASLPAPPPESTEPETLEEREQQASQQGAFNEETGEINWECPCLGGMAHGPCGEQFRGAFSCFVFSKADPKGMDCIDHFKTMQDCFRQHPEIYGAELDEDDDDTRPEAEAPTPSPGPPPNANDTPIPTPVIAATTASETDTASDTERARAATRQVKREHGEPTSESDELVPKAASLAPPSDANDTPIPTPATAASPTPPSAAHTAATTGASSSDTERARAATRQVERDHGEPTSESDELVPKAAHDASGADVGK